MTLADKLDRLFATVPNPETGRPYSNPAAAAAIARMVAELPEAERDGRSISQTYIWQLREGRRSNPTVKHLESLGALFGVGPDYFLNESVYRRVDRELTDRQRMREQGVEQFAFRARELSPAGFAAVQAALEHARALEGLPPASGSDDPAGPGSSEATER